MYIYFIIQLRLSLFTMYTYYSPYDTDIKVTTFELNQLAFITSKIISTRVVSKDNIARRYI